MSQRRVVPIPRSLAAVAAVAAVAGIAALAACRQSPSHPPNQCVDGWPAAQPFSPAAPIPGVEPAILWRTPVTTVAANDWLLVNDERVAFTASGRLFLLDKDGNYIGGRSSASRGRVTAAAADEDGNFYFAGRNIYSVDRDGALRWLVPLSELSADPPRAAGRVVLSPDGTMFFGATDGHLYAIDMRDGTRRWRRQVTDEDGKAPLVMAGAGNAVMAFARGNDIRPQMWRTSDGEPLSRFLGPGGEYFGAMLGRSLGIVAQRMEDRGGAYPWMHVAVLDACAAERWTLTPTRPQWPVLIGPGDRLYVAERDDQEHSPTFVSVYEPDGTRAAGPTAMPLPWGIGADGTLYAVACDSSAHEGPSRLYAYDMDLNQRWMLPLGDSCPMTGPVIDDQGRLYFTWNLDSVTEVVAVQTTSPGLAPTSWPTRRHDSRGTGWLE